MLDAFPKAYGVKHYFPDEKTITSVLGKSHVNEGHLAGKIRTLFDDYHANFNLGSKPATHLRALSKLTDEELLEGLPQVFVRMIDHVRTRLAGLPE